MLVNVASFSTNAQPGSTMSADLRERRLQHALHDEGADLARGRAATIQSVSPSDPSGPESMTYSTFTAPVSTAARRPVTSAGAVDRRPVLKPRSLRAAQVRRIHRRNPELRVGRLRLLAIPPAERHAAGERRQTA